MSLYTCRLLISIYQGKHKHWIITRFSHRGIEHIVDFTTFLPDSVSTPIRRFRDHLTAHLASHKWVCKWQKCVLAAEDNYSETPECGGIIPNTQQTDQHARSHLPCFASWSFVRQRGRNAQATFCHRLTFCPHSFVPLSDVHGAALNKSFARETKVSCLHFLTQSARHLVLKRQTRFSRAENFTHTHSWC